MKFTKAFIGVFLLTFFIGLISIATLRSGSDAAETKIPVAENAETENPPLPAGNETALIKSDIIFYEVAEKFGGVELLTDNYGEKEEKAKYELLQIGEFHGDEVSAKSGEKWLGLFADDNNFALRREEITVRRVRDFMDDKNSLEENGKSVSIKSATKPLFLLEYAAKVKEGKVETLFKGATLDEVDQAENPTTELKKGFVQTYQIGGKEYTLRVDRVFNRKAKIIYALILESGQTKQILHASEEDYLGTLFWVGDLDRDNKPDFFMSPFIKENVTELSLFISSEADKNNLVKKVASMVTIGC